MISVFVANKVDRRRVVHSRGPLEIGRQPREGVARLVLQDPYVGRQQLRVEEVAESRVRLQNLSQKTSVSLADGTTLEPGSDRELGLPVRLVAGETLIDIEAVAAEEPIDRATLQTISPPVLKARRTTLPPLSGLGESPSPEKLIQWMEIVVSVQRSAASSPNFTSETARAVVQLVGLDCGLVLMRRDDDWEVMARHTTHENRGEPEFSRAILRCVCEERRTFFQVLPGGSGTGSLMGVSAVVAAPIFADEDNSNVVGVVYGSRFQESGSHKNEIRPLEAQLVQVLAAAVGAGLARLKSEAEATRRYVLFEQFFSADLARELERDPALLVGRDREVTVLFSDINGFSKISQRLPARETCELVGDVMSQFTSQVRAHGGVVVDYYGDGLLAMWNAPVDQPDHPLLAARAALAMQAELPALSARWQDRVGHPLRVGIGLNTGLALVGNTGSKHMFKYGPLGHAVNLASRVEGATKQLGVPVLVTGSTRKLLADSFATRRLCRARVVGIEGAVELHELHAEQAEGNWLARASTYEQGLEQFETGKWSEACHTLYPLLAGTEGRDDLPTLSLIGRAIECLKSPPDPFDPVVDLAVK